ncbi:MAG: DUF2798 domain-containing protein [Lysobacteraceae bacterium]|nr:MAG: DUF2798 domain-containing protein [Xanthomonadaceae bacterium]
MNQKASPAPDDTARAQRLLPATLATCMSAFVAAVVTAINTGLDPGFVLRWLKAWAIALPAAVLAAYAFRPLAWRMALWVVRAMPHRD